jgi:hypothetical protein
MAAFSSYSAIAPSRSPVQTSKEVRSEAGAPAASLSPILQASPPTIPDTKQAIALPTKTPQKALARMPMPLARFANAELRALLFPITEKRSH